MTKTFKPTTPSLRFTVLPTLLELDPSGKKIPKSLLEPKRRQSARNNNGHITCRHKGGGHKRRFRVIDFARDKENIPAVVASIEYDPNRSSLIALLHYKDGEKRFILATKGMKVGDEVITTDQPIYKSGNCMKLKDMPIGSEIHNIEISPGKGGQFVRSAGSSAQIQGGADGYVFIKMPSGEIRKILEDCKATFGAVSNSEHELRVYGKAGRKRWLGIRPTVRGVHMNPVDHPHGGGEGRGKGNHPVSPWKQHAKGHRTRHPKRSRKMIVKERR
jgi:large subunit ribosomal protein L2